MAEAVQIPRETHEKFLRTVQSKVDQLRTLGADTSKFEQIIDKIDGLVTRRIKVEKALPADLAGWEPTKIRQWIRNTVDPFQDDNEIEDLSRTIKEREVKGLGRESLSTLFGRFVKYLSEKPLAGPKQILREFNSPEFNIGDKRPAKPKEFLEAEAKRLIDQIGAAETPAQVLDQWEKEYQRFKNTGVSLMDAMEKLKEFAAEGTLQSLSLAQGFSDELKDKFRDAITKEVSEGAQVALENLEEKRKAIEEARIELPAGVKDERLREIDEKMEVVRTKAKEKIVELMGTFERPGAQIVSEKEKYSGLQVESLE